MWSGVRAGWESKTLESTAQHEVERDRPTRDRPAVSTAYKDGNLSSQVGAKATHLLPFTVSCSQLKLTPPPTLCAHSRSNEDRQQGVPLAAAASAPGPSTAGPVGAAQGLDLVVPSLMRVQSAPWGCLYLGITAKADIC